MKFARILFVTLATVAAPATLASAQAVPPPPEQLGVDCRSRTYAVDADICEDAALRSQDDRVRQFLQGRNWQRPPDSAFMESHYDWLRRRARCAFQRDRRACLADAYAERIDVIEAQQSPQSAGGASMRCDPVGWRNGTRVRPHGRATLLYDGAGILMGVGLPDPPSSWRPFLQVVSQGRDSLRLQANGRSIRCTRARHPWRPPIVPKPPDHRPRERPTQY